MQNTVDPQFFEDIKALGKEIRNDAGPDDLAQLKKIEWWGRISSLIGYSTAWLGINPLAFSGIAIGKSARWMIITHHVSHRGFDKVPGVPKKYQSHIYAQGLRRFIDWFDWIEPQAWAEEHNQFHHYNTGDPGDPDRVEDNLEWLRKSWIPMPARYLIVMFLAMTWKIIYYAPNTLLHVKASRQKGVIQFEGPPWQNFMQVLLPTLKKCWLPYISWHFIVLPSLFFIHSKEAAAYVLFNSLIAEVITNIHTFFMITPNHAGNDLYHFDTPMKSRNEFYLRQILSSVNYRCGGDINDFFHGWLNYQIEHHVWPEFSLLQYQKAQPRLKELCSKYQIPYKQESVFIRIKKTIDVMVGKSSNKVYEKPVTGISL